MRIGGKSLDIYCLDDRRLRRGLLSLILHIGGCRETADVLQTTSVSVEERCASISLSAAPEKSRQSDGVEKDQPGCAGPLTVTIHRREGSKNMDWRETGQPCQRAETDQDIQPPLSDQLKNRPEPVPTEAPKERGAICVENRGKRAEEIARVRRYLQAATDELDRMLKEVYK